jgi:hypothetical protein
MSAVRRSAVVRRSSRIASVPGRIYDGNYADGARGYPALMDENIRKARDWHPTSSRSPNEAELLAAFPEHDCSQSAHIAIN